MNEAVEIAGLGDLEASAGQLIVQTSSQQQAAKLAAMAQRALQGLLDGMEYLQARAAQKQSDETEAEEHRRTTSVAEQLRHSGSSVLPEVGLVLKAGDQGSLEAVLSFVDERNKLVKKGDTLSTDMQQAIQAATTTAAAATAAATAAAAVTDSSSSNNSSSSSGGSEMEGDGDAAAAAANRRKQLLQQWRPLRIVRSGVGPVTLSDVNYAHLTGAIVLAFGVPLLDGVKQIRNEKTIVEGLKVKSMQKSKEGVASIPKGNAAAAARGSAVCCGMNRWKGRDGAIIFDSSFNEFQEGDILLAFEEREKSPPAFLGGHHFMNAPA
ncbi:elongation factor Tu GTP-binding domain-containing protein, putative [Eimeria praecox]|uniref:Elongation factor Tu GTP-binding domain-containing protein, putative n=1 Tax=Eimeria praecox TaxID=51316 RepID=U6G2Y2_9EIME|nr:elongation factor Tu GTP-binding domain-containing protein, putative [Eimeria praecox]